MRTIDDAIEISSDDDKVMERMLSELAALRRDRETLRKVMDVVERRDAHPDYRVYCVSRFREIQRLVREQEKEKANG